MNTSSASTVASTTSSVSHTVAHDAVAELQLLSDILNRKGPSVICNRSADPSQGHSAIERQQYSTEISHSIAGELQRLEHRLDGIEGRLSHGKQRSTLISPPRHCGSKLTVRQCASSLRHDRLRPLEQSRCKREVGGLPPANTRQLWNRVKKALVIQREVLQQLSRQQSLLDEAEKQLSRLPLR
jgi:hypothetical protein